ncbi:MAG: tRNA (guanosine(37)-N1)-methyltransferase TrmD [Archangium sp.]|nr:tRNA (guanosine(37)-N1)-methyltransferase TrmD [Archangium sp.]
MFQCEVLTLFPSMIRGYTGESILGKALERGHVSLTVTDVRDFAPGKHRVTDDAPYGGGAGMVMKVEPLVGAIEAAKARLPGALVVVLSPRGRTLTQRDVHAFHARGSLICVCGRYEGIDERVMGFVDDEVSIGDYVLTGGELGALVLFDAVARLEPGVLGNGDSSTTESFEGDGLLEHPHYTRPPTFRELDVPAVLQGGDHRKIARWRRWQALHLTRARRPELLERAALTSDDRKLLTLREDEL